MAQTVYVALSGTYHEGVYVLGVASTEEKAKAIAEADFRQDEEDDDAKLAWNGRSADVSDDHVHYYEVRACVVDG